MPLKIEQSRKLSEFSTFGIGGPIRFFCEVSTPLEMQEALCLNLPTLILGKGSNSLFDDEGFDGLVILNKIEFCSWSDASVEVGAGYSFSLLGVQSARRGFSGLEFASGIPASVGGAIFMNAGANGSETADRLESVTFCTKEGLKCYSRKELVFSYRSSSFQNMQGAIVSAVFCLQPDPLARKKQLKIVEYRLLSQPLKQKSIGCIFQNPPSISAGALIDQCGLKGVRVGGAKVSEIHANFMVNDSFATAKDVKELIELVQKRVFEKTGIALKPEIRMIDAK